MGSGLELCQITNNQINHNLIEIIQLSLKIFDLWFDTPTYGQYFHNNLVWVICGSLGLDDILLKPPQPFTGIVFDARKLIKIIQFCLKVFRWFKFTLKPPNRITREKLRLAIWDTSFWTFWVKFGHNGP